MSELILPKTQAGPVTWEGLKAELGSLPKETLVNLYDVWLKNFWSTQSYWMVYTEEKFDFKAAGEMDEKVWGKVGPIQAHRMKKALKLGDDIQALATMFKLTAPQWVTAGFDWEFTEINDKKLKMTVHNCPMGTYRKSNNLELLPCKNISPPLYIAMTKVINEDFDARCLHAHPDPPKDGIMCIWECGLLD